ncbi:hypothetical protein RI367_006862 [Sorochytrium milnesiophthora]
MTSTYRDRAAERRQGTNSDYAESDAIVAQLRQASSNSSENVLGADDSTSIATASDGISYEQSKYFGGDEKHTHLVKGLDFALLRKMRGRDQGPSDTGEAPQLPPTGLSEADAELLRRLQEADTANAHPPTFNSVLAKQVYTIVTSARTNTTATTGPVKQNDMFAPGRLSYVFNLDKPTLDAFEQPSTVIRSKADVRGGSGASGTAADDKVVLDKVIAVLEQLRAAKDSELARKLKKDAKKAAVAAPPPKKPPPPPRPPAPVPGDQDDEEDMFGGVGSEYKLQVARAPLATTSDSTKTKYFDDADDDDNNAAATVASDAALTSVLAAANAASAAPAKSSASTATPHKSRLGRAQEDVDMLDMDVSESAGFVTANMGTDFASHVVDDADDADGDAAFARRSTEPPAEKLLTRFHFDTEAEWVKYQKQHGI